MSGIIVAGIGLVIRLGISYYFDIDVLDFKTNTCSFFSFMGILGSLRTLIKEPLQEKFPVMLSSSGDGVPPQIGNHSPTNSRPGSSVIRPSAHGGAGSSRELPVPAGNRPSPSRGNSVFFPSPGLNRPQAIHPAPQAPAGPSSFLRPTE